MKLDTRKETERMEECTTEATHTLYEQSQPPSAEVCRLLCGVFGSALRVDAACDSFRLQFTPETHECTVVSVHESYDPELSKRHEWLAKHLHGFKREMVFRCVPERNIDVVLKHGLLGVQAEPLDEEELLCVTSDACTALKAVQEMPGGRRRFMVFDLLVGREVQGPYKLDIYDLDNNGLPVCTVVDDTRLLFCPVYRDQLLLRQIITLDVYRAGGLEATRAIQHCAQAGEKQVSSCSQLLAQSEPCLQWMAQGSTDGVKDDTPSLGHGTHGNATYNTAAKPDSMMLANMTGRHHPCDTEALNTQWLDEGVQAPGSPELEQKRLPLRIGDHVHLRNMTRSYRFCEGATGVVHEKVVGNGCFFLITPDDNHVRLLVKYKNTKHFGETMPFPCEVWCLPHQLCKI